MSRHKIHTPIFALTTRVQTQRAMSMYRNVTPLRLDVSADKDIAMRQVEERLLSIGVVDRGDIIALTCGEPMGTVGGTNTLKIVKVK